MSRHPVEESEEFELALDREDRTCPKCGGRMHVRCRRSRSILTLEGPLRLSVGLVQCCDERCEHMTLYNPEQEYSLAMPRWGIGWDVFCWIGQRRCSRHWSVPQIRNELRDTYDLRLSDDAIEDHIASYQNMVAARHQDPQELATLYRDTKEIGLTIVGLQPEKGHATLYVVREVTQSRVWFVSLAASCVRNLPHNWRQLGNQFLSTGAFLEAIEAQISPAYQRCSVFQHRGHVCRH